MPRQNCLRRTSNTLAKCKQLKQPKLLRLRTITSSSISINHTLTAIKLLTNRQHRYLGSLIPNLHNRLQGTLIGTHPHILIQLRHTNLDLLDIQISNLIRFLLMYHHLLQKTKLISLTKISNTYHTFKTHSSSCKAITGRGTLLGHTCILSSTTTTTTRAGETTTHRSITTAKVLTLSNR